MIPAFLIRPLIYVCVLGLWGGMCFYKGCTYSESAYIKSGILEAKNNAKLLSEAIKESEDKTRKLYEDEITKLKNRKPLPDKCVLSPDFRRLHDSATGMPKSTTAHSVTIEDAARTIEDNYFACRQNSIWLEECNRICK